MATHSITNLKAHLKAFDFNYPDLKDALDGKALPADMGRPLARACVIRGIRYHDTCFAESLRSLVATPPEFTRALNACSIMSGVVPVINSAEEIPYCMWHPDIAPEHTYLELWQRYGSFPLVPWVAARACATAGYFELYRELGLVPCVEVAEEARESDRPGSDEIYEITVREATRYSVMDDYTRTIREPRPGAFLSGDTQVRANLDRRGRLQDQEMIGLRDDEDDESVFLIEHPIDGGGAIFNIR